MDKEKVIVATETELTRIVSDAIELSLKKVLQSNTPEGIKTEKITKSKACDRIGISISTRNKRIKERVFKQHSIGRKRYMLKSEIIQTLKNGN